MSFLFNKGQKIKGTVVLDFNTISSIPDAGVSEAVGGFFGAATDIIGNTVDNVTSVFSHEPPNFS
ncbi:Seed linoleate 9S-lipoxygenase [Arachis hypogaea]|uniref:Seed linoleate 9S-lipoxygenase n=1 Tax=Arachis hypogaea TaxID=3818 RepID=A0A6B9V640_ARAHY|nr:Seed linoleate 9S-lipoxygenase [Arachis hypogaea]